MHWFFYVVAGLVTALAIYVQMKRVDKGNEEHPDGQVDASPKEQKEGSRNRT